MRIIHPISPVYDKASTLLILGSFPSVKSREQMFFYGHKQNRFWKVMARVFDDEVPETIEQKENFLHKHHVAVWDVIAECDIEGSADSTIKNVVPNDLSIILEAANIRKIFCNGSKSFELYSKYIEPGLGRPATKLPSTSPANAAMKLEKLSEVWKEALL